MCIRDRNMREGFLFGFKALTWAKGDFLILLLFSLVFLLLFLLLCSDVITKTSIFHRHKTFPKYQTSFRVWHVLATYEIRNLQRLRSFQRLQSPSLDSVCKLMLFSFPVATYASFARRNIIINGLPCPYLFSASIRNVILPFLTTASHHRRLITLTRG